MEEAGERVGGGGDVPAGELGAEDGEAEVVDAHAVVKCGRGEVLAGVGVDVLDERVGGEGEVGDKEGFGGLEVGCAVEESVVDVSRDGGEAMFADLDLSGGGHGGGRLWGTIGRGVAVLISFGGISLRHLASNTH